jgi:hypothetical protein
VNIRARPTTPEPKVIEEAVHTDERAQAKLLRDVRAAKASDKARGTGPKISEPERDTFSVAPKPNTTPDLHSALNDLADQLLDGDPGKPMTVGNLAWALHSLARKLAPKPTPELEEQETA